MNLQLQAPLRSGALSWLIRTAVLPRSHPTTASPSAEACIGLLQRNARPPRSKKVDARWQAVQKPANSPTTTAESRSAWASGHFSGQIARRDLLLVVGVTPTGNGDAGKFAADTTQLPTGCQPGSLAKPARRPAHKAIRGSCLRAAARRPH